MQLLKFASICIVLLVLCLTTFKVYISHFPSEENLQKNIDTYLKKHYSDLSIWQAASRLGINNRWLVGLRDEEGVCFFEKWDEGSRSFPDITKYSSLKRKIALGISIQETLKNVGIVIVPDDVHPWANQLSLSNEQLIFDFHIHVLHPRSPLVLEEVKEKIRQAKDEILTQGEESYISGIDAAIIFYDHILTDSEKASLHYVQPSSVYRYKFITHFKSDGGFQDKLEWEGEDRQNVDLKSVPEWKWAQLLKCKAEN